MQITQWHKGTDKPVRDGVYERAYAFENSYCKFKNGKWKWPADTISLAIKEDANSLSQDLKWRGVTKP